MYGQSAPTINISGLNARLFPTPLPFPDSFQRASAHLRTETLQGTSPLVRELLVAPRSVADVLEKNVLE
jgi:hypothetical protein